MGTKFSLKAPAIAGAALAAALISGAVVASAQQRFGNHDPRIIVAKNPSVFFVTRRIRADLTEFSVIL